MLFPQLPGGSPDDGLGGASGNATNPPRIAAQSDHACDDALEGHQLLRECKERLRTGNDTAAVSLPD
jgi:hypothetical protein